MSLGLHIIFFGLAFFAVARLFQIIEKGRAYNDTLKRMMRAAYFVLKQSGPRDSSNGMRALIAEAKKTLRGDK